MKKNIDNKYDSDIHNYITRKSDVEIIMWSSAARTRIFKELWWILFPKVMDPLNFPLRNDSIATLG